MNIVLAANAGSTNNPLWYATRSFGLVTFVLLTVTVLLGVLSTQRVATPQWPRFASQALHRNVSILAMLFLAVHVLTTLLDSYVKTSWSAAIVPGTSSYRTHAYPASSAGLEARGPAATMLR